MVVPNDLDAEAAVLGACMVNSAWRDQSLAVLTADDFHLPAHAAVFQAIMDAHAEGQPADHTAIAFRAKSVNRERLLTIQASAPLSLSAPLGIVADNAARRRLIGLGESIVARAADLDRETGATVAETQRQLEDVRLPVDQFIPARDATELLEGDDDYQWLVPRLIEAGDRVVWTAGEGVGKSTWQLQQAVMFASGIHPITRYPIRRLRVLVVDLENSERQLRRLLKRLLGAADDQYRGGLRLTEPRPAGIDLRNARDFRWLDRHCEQVRPEVLVIGPLYKAFRVRGGEKKTDETAAEEAAFALDRLRERYGCAVSIEAHSPHGSGGDREGLRPYGASLWLRWPEFGFGMKPIAGEQAVELRTWRGMRDRDRDWPDKLFVGHKWPWEA